MLIQNAAKSLSDALQIKTKVGLLAKQDRM